MINQGGKILMESSNLDWILEAEELVKGLLDTMLTIRTAQQDELIPLTILCPFEVVLKRVDLLLKEIEESIRE